MGIFIAAATAFYRLHGRADLSALLLFDEVDGYPSIYVVILLVLFGALALIGTIDLLQTRHAVLRNYPLSAHIRFILEDIMPEKSGNIFWKARKTARRSPATSARWSISAPSVPSTSGRSAPKTMFTRRASNGWRIRSRRKWS